jgi:CrcB protein
MLRFLLVCLGGAIGSGARYAVALAIGPSSLPYATLIVNVIGSFALAFLANALPSLSGDVRVMLAAGVLGGFTTYSTFNYETIELARGGAWAMAMLNIVVTVLACLVAGLLGLALARK